MTDLTVEQLIERVTPAGVQAMKAGMLEDVLDALAAQAQQDAPKRRGFGSPKSIVSRIKPLVVRPRVWGVVRSGAPHSHLPEFGVQAHPLRPGSGKRRKRKGSAGVMRIWGSDMILRRSAQHPGLSGQPFLQPAPDKAAAEVDEIMRGSGEALFTDVRRWKRKAKRAR